MTAHKHAALMAEYAKDAAETDKPWEQWEFQQPDVSNQWFSFPNKHPLWDENVNYRRKRVPLCQVEGKDVFPGDRLWHEGHKTWLVARSRSEKEDFIYCEEGYHALISYLSWSEPPRTKTVYQWAIKGRDGNWHVHSTFHSNERELLGDMLRDPRSVDVRRLDWTALEVPA